MSDTFPIKKDDQDSFARPMAFWSPSGSRALRLREQVGCAPPAPQPLCPSGSYSRGVKSPLVTLGGITDHEIPKVTPRTLNQERASAS